MSVALSAHGNTALIGAGEDNDEEGAAWVFTRRGGLWSQQGAKLIADCTSLAGCDADAVALSARGNVALLGQPGDGGVRVFARQHGQWSQQGSKLVGDCTGSCGGAGGTHTWNQAGSKLVSGATAPPDSPCCGFGDAVALSGDASTALLSAPSENDQAGVVYVFGQPR